MFKKRLQEEEGNGKREGAKGSLQEEEGIWYADLFLRLDAPRVGLVC